MARNLIVSGRSITACFIFLSLIKPKEKAPAQQTFCSPSPQRPQSPVGGAFLAHLPFALPPCRARHVTASSHGLPAPRHCHPNPLRACFFPILKHRRKPLNMPCSLVTLLLRPQMTIWKANSAHNLTFNMNKGISLQLKSHSDTQMRHVGEHKAMCLFRSNSKDAGRCCASA